MNILCKIGIHRWVYSHEVKSRVPFRICIKCEEEQKILKEKWRNLKNGIKEENSKISEN